MVVPTFRNTQFVRPGSGRSAFTQLGRPPSTSTILQGRAQGVALDPQTGRVLGSIQTPGSAASIARRTALQDRAFAQAIGGLSTQLGVTSPRAGGVALRPEQVAQLIALRRGEDPVGVLGGGPTRAASPLPTRALGGAGGFSLNAVGEPVPVTPGADAAAGGPGGLPGPLLLAGLAAVALLLVFR